MDSSSQAVAEAAWGSGDAHVPSVATRQSRPEAVGARGAPHLPLSFPSKPSPSAPWAWGLLSASWERGSPDLPACGPRCGSISGPVRPIFNSKHSRPSRGAEPHEADDARPPRGAASPGWLARGGEIKARGTSRGSCDVSHDDRGQAGASAQCPHFLFGAKEASAGAVSQHYKKYTSVMIRVCHSRSRLLSCMYIHDNFMTESR